MTAEEYIKDFTRGYSNELENGEFEYWLTPWQAEAACNLAREEVREQFKKKRLKHYHKLTIEQAQIERDFFVQHLEKNNRTPTFSDAIEYGKRLMIDRANKLEELGQAMYDRMQNLTTDCTGIRAAMDKWWCYINRLNKED